MDHKRLTELIDKVREGTANEEEALALEDFYEQFERKPGYIDHLDTPQKIAYKELLYDRIQSGIQYTQQSKKIQKPKEKILHFTIAASILFVLGIGAYIYMTTPAAVQQPEIVASTPLEMEMDKNKPILTLASGKKISLDDAAVGVLSSDGNVIVRKMDDGSIAYDSKHSKPDHLEYNLIEIPRGQTYRLILPDGTNVWLNALSSLRYSSAFSGEERSVELTGEAYFEVAHDQQRPFVVKTADQTIEVLGTHFNVSNYSDDKSTKTTLIEGRVRVLHQDHAVVLKPGQQASTTSGNTAINVAVVDPESVLAWRKGVILFENAGIKYIMRQLARKYNMEVEYVGEITDQKFGGAFQESVSLKELLNYLESYGDVRFVVQGRRVIVMK